jgi:predicted dehydrogenase
MANAVRIGVIGAGFIGRVHLDQFRKQGGVRLVGVADQSRQLAEKAAADYGVEETFKSAEDLIDSPDIDAVVVGVPNQYHLDLSLRALRAGRTSSWRSPWPSTWPRPREIARLRKETGRSS